MTRQEIEDLVKKALYDVAPDIAGLDINPDETFREQFEIDSMDFLNFTIGLTKATGLQIPEADSEKLATLKGAVDYLQAKLSPSRNNQQSN